MKARTLPLFLAAAIALVGFDLHAQNAQPVRVKSVESKAAVAVSKLNLVELPEGSLQDAVQNLKDRLEVEGLPPMNIVFSHGADDLPVPDLILRNVTGADALRLLSTAADCELETIYSEPETPEQRTPVRIIGYRIIPRTPPSRASRGYGFGGAPRTARPAGSVDPFAGATGTVKSSMASSYGTASGGVASVTRVGGAGTTSRTSGGSSRIVNYGVAKPQLLTRVYALGRITTRAKFPEVEKTLLATLEVAGQKPSDATLALHEKTNVLVVRASDEVHELVGNLLESLAKNSADADTGEVADLERKIRALLTEMENVKQMSEMRIREAEDRRREVENELRVISRRLQDSPKARESKP